MDSTGRMELDLKTKIYSEQNGRNTIATICFMGPKGIRIWCSQKLSHRGDHFFTLSKFTNGKLHCGRVIHQEMGDDGFYIDLSVPSSRLFEQDYHMAKSHSQSA